MMLSRNGLRSQLFAAKKALGFDRIFEKFLMLDGSKKQIRSDDKTMRDALVSAIRDEPNDNALIIAQAHKSTIDKNLRGFVGEMVTPTTAKTTRAQSNEYLCANCGSASGGVRGGTITSPTGAAVSGWLCIGSQDSTGCFWLSQDEASAAQEVP